MVLCIALKRHATTDVAETSKRRKLAFVATATPESVVKVILLNNN